MSSRDAPCVNQVADVDDNHVYTLAPVDGPLLTRVEIVSRIRRAVIANPKHFGIADFGIVAPLGSLLEFVCDDAVKLGDVWRSLVEHGLASGWQTNDGEPFFAIAGLGSLSDAVADRIHDFTGKRIDAIVVKRRAA